MYNLNEFKIVFDPLLEKFLDKKIKGFNALTTDEFVKEFTAYSKKLILASGKRVRPCLAYLMYCAYGGKDEKNALNIFLSLEIFHTFALVHDDIMDKASIRHGIPTVNEYVFKRLKDEKKFGDLPHVANSQAILVGDLLFGWALEIFNNNIQNFREENFNKAKEYFYKMVDEVILGQMLDVDITTKKQVDKSLIDEKTRLKTSRYTCVRPMQIGAWLANVNYVNDSFLEDLGTNVGVAFQIQDDLLDIIGDSHALTKDTLRDIESRQHTFFTNYIYENGSEIQKKEFGKYFGKNIKEEEKDNVRKLFVESGAIEAGKKIILENLRHARKITEKADFEADYKNNLLGLINIIEKRQN